MAEAPTDRYQATQLVSLTIGSEAGKMVVTDLPVMPPVKPMLAKLVSDIPDGEFSYEPKWDAFV